jgi:hypothetical protein
MEKRFTWNLGAESLTDAADRARQGAPWNAVRALCKKTGATYESGHAFDGFEVEVHAPEGMHFKMLDVHSAISRVEIPTARREAWAGALEDMQGGFERCTAETCSQWEDGRCLVWGHAE